MTIQELRRLADAGTWKYTQHSYGRTAKLLIDADDADRIVEAWLYAPDTWEHVAEVIADWLRAEIRATVA